MYGTGVDLKNPCYPTPITGSRPRDLSRLYKEIGNHENPTEGNGDNPEEAEKRERKKAS